MTVLKKSLFTFVTSDLNVEKSEYSKTIKILMEFVKAIRIILISQKLQQMQEFPKTRLKKF